MSTENESRSLVNGLHCPIADAWEDYRDRCMAAITKIDGIAPSLRVIEANTTTLVTVFTQMQQSLIGPATSKSQVDTETVRMILRNKDYVWGAVVIVLLAVIYFLITGKPLSLPPGVAP